MSAPVHRCAALRKRIHSLTSWLVRGREAPIFGPLVRRGGGLLVLIALSVFAGWSLNKIPGVGDAPTSPTERCLQVTGVVRLATGRPEVPGPLLLLQTAWMEDPNLPGSRSSDDACPSSGRMLPVPPVHNRVFQRRRDVFELIPSPELERVLDGLFAPLPDLQDRPTGASSHPSPEAT